MTIRSNQQQGMVLTGFFRSQNNDPGKNGYTLETPLNPEEQYGTPSNDQVLPNVDSTTQLTDEDESANKTVTENEDAKAMSEETDVQEENTEESDEEDDDEDDDDDYYGWPFFTSKRSGQQPSFNFFPIAFGGPGRSSGNPFGTAAIANSFSTGKKGVASSSGTAYGEATSAKYDIRSQSDTTGQLNNVSNQYGTSNETPLNSERQNETSPTDELTQIDSELAQGSEVLQESTTEMVETTTKIEEISEKKTNKQEPEDDEGDSVFIPKAENQQPFYNFFPIAFGSSGRSAENPTGTVAIANSLSTGRGGIAMSDAKALNSARLRKEFENARYQRPEGMMCAQFYNGDNKGKIQMKSNYDVSLNSERSYEPLNKNKATNVQDSVEISEENKENRNKNKDLHTQLDEIETSTLFSELAPGTTTENVKISTKIEKADKKIKKQDVDSAEEGTLFTSSNDQEPSTNFFPIDFNGDGRSAGNTAIANSFSTGQNGVAMSDAKASGEPGIPESESDNGQRKQEMVELQQNNGPNQEGFNDTITDEESTEQIDGLTTELLAETTTAYLETTTDYVGASTENVETTTNLDEIVAQKTLKKNPKKESNFFSPRRGQQPSSNFFPISFGGYGRSVGEQIGTVAIANSFSTGKGGIASSRSTSYGEAFSSRNDAKDTRYAQSY